VRTTSYHAIREQVYSLLNLVAADAAAGDKTKINAFVQRRAREAFTFYWWPETMRIEERFYRAAYAAGTAYVASTSTASTEVYHPASKAYYQAIKAGTGNAPATLSGGSYTTNLAYWAPVAEEYSADDWADATAYVAGNTVRDLTSGLFYRCHTAHTSSGSLDATKFGLLVEWLPYVSLDQSGKTAIGQVRGVYLDHPGRVRNPRRVAFVLGPNGVHLPEVTTTSVFAWFQLKPPVLSGADYAALSTYTAGAVIYYASATPGYEGDHWVCAATTSAGENPETAAAKWVKQEIPEALRDAIAHAAYADYLRPAADTKDVPIEETVGGQFLISEVRKISNMQRQAGKWTFE
jgi:hypothetical protein